MRYALTIEKPHEDAVGGRRGGDAGAGGGEDREGRRGIGGDGHRDRSRRRRQALAGRRIGLAQQRADGQARPAEVGRDGSVVSTRVISGPPLLCDAAANALQQWRYRPYMYAGKPIATNATVVMDFQLN